jgi:sodium transport system permease protein
MAVENRGNLGADAGARSDASVGRPWSAILSVFRKEFRENLRDRRTVGAALVFGPLFGPLLFAAALSLMIHRGEVAADRPVKLAVSHAERAPNLLDFLRQYQVMPELVSLDDDAARQALNEHRYTMVLSVSGDFGSRFAGGEPATVSLYADASDTSTGRDVPRVRSLLTQYGSTIARMRAIVRGVDPLVLTPIVVEDIDVSTPSSRAVLFLSTFSYLVVVTLLMGGMYLCIDATAGERERGSLEPLLTVPVKREYLIYGKVLTACAYMTLSLVLTVAIFAIVLRRVDLARFGMTLNFGPLIAAEIVLCCLPLVPVGAGLMTIVASFTRSYREAQTYLGLILAIPTLPLVFASAMGLRPTAPLMAVPSLSQHFLITSLLRDEPIPAAYLALSIGVTLAVGVVLVRIAGRLYHREALLG